MLRERIGSFTIIFHGKILRMLCAVQFDDKLMRWTSEINDITKDWQLPAETQAFKSVGTERVPQGQLGIRHGFAHFARVNSVLRLYVCVGHDQPT